MHLQDYTEKSLVVHGLHRTKVDAALAVELDRMLSKSDAKAVKRRE